MVKPEYFTINFNNEKTTFYAGQVIEGQVRFRFKHPERAKALTILFTGTEATYNTPVGTKRVPSETEIFKVKQILHNPPCGFYDAKGYIFPFKVELGSYNFPSSYEGDWANIRYKFKAIIDRPSRFGHSTSTPITLLSSIPNFVPDLIKPEVFKTEGTYGTFYRETIKISAETKFRSCCPGGKFLLDISVYPLNTRSITSLDINLIQEVSVISQSRPIVTQNTITNFNVVMDPQGGLEDGDEELIRILVPSSTPPNVESSHYINISYYLLISAGISWSLVPLTIKIPVKISTLNITDDEVPPLISSSHYISPTIEAGEHICVEDNEHSNTLPTRSRNSLTPSLISDISSVYSTESEDLETRRKFLFNPNYSPVCCDVFTSEPNNLPSLSPLHSPRAILT